MASPFHATLILCDAAIVDAGGKVSMLGAGWDMTGSPTALQAVSVLIKVPWVGPTTSALALSIGPRPLPPGR